MGLKGKDPTRGEETELMDRLLAAGRKGMYVPGAVVHHCNPRNRMTEKYVRLWFKGDGMVQVRRGQIPLDKLWFGAPRWVYRRYLVEGLKYVLMRWTRPPAIWLRAEIRMATAWGMICEARRRTR